MIRMLASCLMLTVPILCVFSETPVKAQVGIAMPKLDVSKMQTVVSTILHPIVSSDLEIVAEQNTELTEISKGISQQISAAFLEHRDKVAGRKPAFEDMKALAEAVDTINSRAETKISSILLPQQMKRLKQIQFQQELSGMGVGSLVQKQDLAVKLNVAAEQKEIITKQYQESEREIARVVSRMRAARDKKLFGLLTLEQKAEWIQLVGKPCPLFSAVADDEAANP